MKKLRKQFSRKNHGKRCETRNRQKSKTIPNETYTIKELLKKHTQGTMPPNIERESSYQEEPNFDSPDYQKINRLDIVDLHRFKNKNQITIDELVNQKTDQEYDLKIAQEMSKKTKPSTKQGTTELLVSGTLGSKADASGTQQQLSVASEG